MVRLVGQLIIRCDKGKAGEEKRGNTVKSLNSVCSQGSGKRIK